MRFQRHEFFKVLLIMRVLTSAVALIPSAFRQQVGSTRLEFDRLELGVEVWPPTRPVTSWIERIGITPWLRWDTKYFVAALNRGFRMEDGSGSFHPLFVWLAKPIYHISGSALFALLTVATIATGLLYFAFNRLARLDLTVEVARKATLLFALYPVSYIFFAPYTESTFLLFSVMTFLFARDRKWFLAGVFGALATLTRQQGLFLMIPVLWELWNAKERRVLAYVPALLIPGAYISWIAYRAFALGDSAPDLSSVQGFIYSVPISPSTYEVVQDQAFLTPPQTLFIALKKMWIAPTFAMSLDLLLAALFVIITIYAWRNMRGSYKLYVLVIILVSFCHTTGLTNSSTYMALPRHLLLAFPVFIGLAPRVSDYAASKLLKVGIFGMLLLTFLHCRGVWVP